MAAGDEEFNNYALFGVKAGKIVLAHEVLISSNVLSLEVLPEEAADTIRKRFAYLPT
jgi:hypothetical protein